MYISSYKKNYSDSVSMYTCVQSYITGIFPENKPQEPAHMAVMPVLLLRPGQEQLLSGPCNGHIE